MRFDGAGGGSRLATTPTGSVGGSREGSTPPWRRARPRKAPRCALAAAALAALLACGKGVDNLSIASAPLGYAHGHVDLADAQSRAGGKPLRAALIWGAVPTYVTPCFRYLDDAAFQAACPDAFGFVPGTVEADVAIDPAANGDFTLPIRRLPDASVAPGTDAARISWGSLVVAADRNGNGAVDLLVAPDAGRMRATDVADTVLSASFFKLDRPQQRIGFRENGWDSTSMFYPTPGCGIPPSGFFVLSTPGMSGRLPTPYDAAPGDCTQGALEGTVTLTSLTAAEAKAFACRNLDYVAARNGQRNYVRRPQATPPDQSPQGGPPQHAPDQQICLDAQTLALVPTGADCGLLSILRLAGCSNDPFCSTPDWDLRSKPPDWWPCAK